MTRMQTTLETRRERIENAQAALGVILAEMDLAKLRVRQAREQSGLGRLLNPLESALCGWEGKIKGVQRELRAMWEDGNQNGWGA